MEIFKPGRENSSSPLPFLIRSSTNSLISEPDKSSPTVFPSSMVPSQHQEEAGVFWDAIVPQRAMGGDWLQSLSPWPFPRQAAITKEVSSTEMKVAKILATSSESKALVQTVVSPKSSCSSLVSNSSLSSLSSQQSKDERPPIIPILRKTRSTSSIQIKFNERVKTRTRMNSVGSSLPDRGPSNEGQSSGHHVAFCPQVSVLEFHRTESELVDTSSSWFSPQDMERFRKDAREQQIAAFKAAQKVALKARPKSDASMTERKARKAQITNKRQDQNTQRDSGQKMFNLGSIFGFGGEASHQKQQIRKDIAQPSFNQNHTRHRLVCSNKGAVMPINNIPQNDLPKKPFCGCFNTQSLCFSTQQRHRLQTEIRSVLIVDKYDIFLKLLSKSLLSIMPHLHIKTAISAEKALAYLDSNPQTPSFDMIVIEERLPRCYNNARVAPTKSNCTALLSGSQLLNRIHQLEQHHLSSLEKNTEKRKHDTLVVGMSAYINEDGIKLKAAGADLLWNKPPPTMDMCLCNEILHTILEKRGKI
eukprot:CAMPEP_0194359670 /NCGR_PEP_ID=MMETSP0174-20130528/6951_1 /TAXON_ID=216777 /ORGANISM="Proboscia alata, Strain PI-D3" /LENGTH=530 /DNA_ID=CAMNT_0039130715 /DNA_START=266 /DNA_END=1858 /DNA_ORIENTATION=+